MKFRKATDQDCDKIVELVNSAYRGDFSKKGWTTEADLLGGQRVNREMVLEMIREPGGCVLLGESEARLVACVDLAVSKRDCYLGMLTVEPSLQAAGLGRELLAQSEGYARSQGCSKMWMTVINTRHELIAWYERRGYVRTGERVAFPVSESKFGLPKVSPEALEMIVLEKRL